MKESSSRAESRDRLMIVVIVFLTGVGLALIVGVIFMQDEITSLRGKVAELNPLRGSTVLHFFKRLQLSLYHRVCHPAIRS